MEFDLPSAIRADVLHPQFERAQLGHDGVDLHGNDLPGWKVRERRQVDFKHAGLFQLTFRIRQDLTWSVAASDRRREKPEFRRAPGQKTEISSFDKEF